MISAAVFPGQGSQKVGMLSKLSQAYPLIRETFQSASTVLGYDLWKLVQEGPAEELTKTQNTQPALLTASIALWRVWQIDAKVKPDYLAGHSLGEYSALVCAGVIDFEEAVETVRKRGELMNAAVPNGEGGMAALMGLEDTVVVECWRQCSQLLQRRLSWQQQAVWAPPCARTAAKLLGRIFLVPTSGTLRQWRQLQQHGNVARRSNESVELAPAHSW